MNQSTIKSLNQIIERESKDSTYKFALLRAAIDIALEYGHYKIDKGNHVSFPMGLLVEKWLLYYYPIFSSQIFIPQKHGENHLQEKGKKIPFRQPFMEVIYYYNDRGGINVFYNDLKERGIPDEISKKFKNLAKSINKKIIEMPMRHLGQSLSDQHYYIFSFNSDNQNINPEVTDIFYLIESFGTFNIKKEFFEIFEYLGGFLTGSDSILMKWADFTVGISSARNIDKMQILQEIMKFPVTERDILISKRFFKELYIEQNNMIKCVWSGSRLREYDIDHVIPFSIWKNNNLWNLLPVKSALNSKKKDKIPAISLLDKRKDGIIYYWELLFQRYSKLFLKEISYSLIGQDLNLNNWKNQSFNALKNKCSYLINYRRYPEWKI